MIDMKLTNEQSQATMLGAEPDENNGPVYPEGLKIEIEGEALKRLAIGPGNLPQVGQRFQLAALVEVVEVCKEEGRIDTEYCVELQITHLELGNAQQRDRQQVDALYGPA